MNRSSYSVSCRLRAAMRASETSAEAAARTLGVSSRAVLRWLEECRLNNVLRPGIPDVMAARAEGGR